MEKDFFEDILEYKMKSKIILVLTLIFVLGYFLRVMFLSSGVLTFGYDQARDAYNALEIVHGHLKVFGPPASQPGLFHGAFYYYVLSPFYALGKGSPIVAAYGLALVNSLGVLLVFCIGYFLSKNTKVGLIAAFLFAISFEATQYATWLSNPTLGIITVPLMYLGLWVWITRRKSFGPLVAALGLGLSIQSEIFLAYHFIPLLIWLWVARKEVTRRQILVFGLVLIATLSTMIVAQLKFGIGGTINGIRGLAVSGSSDLAYEKSIGDYLILYLNQIGRIFSFNSYPGNVGWGGGFIIALIGYSFITRLKNVRNGIADPFVFVSIWLLSHLSVVTVGGTSTPFLMVGIGPAVSIIIALHMGLWLTKKYYLLVGVVLAILVFGNISMIVSQNRGGSTLFSIQKDMVLSKELSAIDFTYEKSKGEKFSINTLTSPLWVNIVWTYLYKWYGINTYGYVPTWHGHGQEGQIDTLETDGGKIKSNFLIIEPLAGIPVRYLDETIGEEDSRSRVLEEKYFGEIGVQVRERI